MRLIDADALADALFEKRKNYPQWVADTIGEMPTIDVDVLLKEQEAEIRQLRLALDIAKGTCKGIKSDGGQFADMPTMQSAT